MAVKKSTVSKGKGSVAGRARAVHTRTSLPKRPKQQTALYYQDRTTILVVAFTVLSIVFVGLCIWRYA